MILKHKIPLMLSASAIMAKIFLARVLALSLITPLLIMAQTSAKFRCSWW